MKKMFERMTRAVLVLYMLHATDLVVNAQTYVSCLDEQMPLIFGDGAAAPSDLEIQAIAYRGPDTDGMIKFAGTTASPGLLSGGTASHVFFGGYWMRTSGATLVR